MIKLNASEKKEIKFDVSVSGVSTQDLKGALRLILEGIEYGFPVSIVEGSVRVVIPALDSFVKDDLKDGQRLDAKLEIIADDTYLVPWKDTLVIETPIKVEAVISEVISVDEVIKPKIIVSKIEEKLVEDKKEEKKEKKKREITSRFRKSMEKK
jgi:hypothetical protein